MTHPRLIGAGVIVLALAATTFLWPREIETPPELPAVSAAPEPRPLSLRHRLADEGWRLVEAQERGEDRRVATPAGEDQGGEGDLEVIRRLAPLS